MSAGNNDNTIDSIRAPLTEKTLYEEHCPHPKRAAMLIGVLALPVTWKLTRYHVHVTESHLHFGFKTLKTSRVMPLDKIMTCKVTTIDRVPAKLGGNSIIQKSQGEIRYQVKKGPAVRVTVQEEGYEQVYIFNCENPNRVCERNNAKL